jgi:hypothetical protein
MGQDEWWVQAYTRRDDSLAMHTLTEALSLAALIAATLEYALVVRHRESTRAEWREREQAGDAGLQGLVRVFLADSPRHHSAYRPE